MVNVQILPSVDSNNTTKSCQHRARLIRSEPNYTRYGTNNETATSLFALQCIDRYRYWRCSSSRRGMEIQQWFAGRKERVQGTGSVCSGCCRTIKWQRQYKSIPWRFPQPPKQRCSPLAASRRCRNGSRLGQLSGPGRTRIECSINSGLRWQFRRTNQSSPGNSGDLYRGTS